MIAIKKHMQNALPSDKKWANAVFLTALKTGVSKGELVQIKGSYKLSPEFKKQLITAKKKAAAPKKKVAPKKKAAPKSQPKRIITRMRT